MSLASGGKTPGLTEPNPVQPQNHLPDKITGLQLLFTCRANLSLPRPPLGSSGNARSVSDFFGRLLGTLEPEPKEKGDQQLAWPGLPRVGAGGCLPAVPAPCSHAGRDPQTLSPSSLALKRSYSQMPSPVASP